MRKKGEKSRRVYSRPLLEEIVMYYIDAGINTRKQIAEATDLSPGFMTHVLSDMRRDGLIVSVRKNGKRIYELPDPEISYCKPFVDLRHTEQ